MQERSPRIAFLVLLLLLIAAFFAIIRPFLLPALFAVLVVVICNPIYNFFTKFLRYRYLAAFASTLVAFLCFLIPLGIITAVIITNITSVTNDITKQLETGQIAQSLDNLNTYLTAQANQYAQFLPSDLNIRSALITLLKTASKAAYQYSPHFISATATVLGGTFLLFILVFALFAEGGRIYNSVFSLLPLHDEHKHVLSREIRGVVTGTFLGMIATSFAQGILIGIGFLIAGIPNPLIWGLIAVGVTLIPVVGGPLMYVPAGIVLLIGGKTFAGTFILAYGVLIVSVIDNLIKPLILRGKVNVHPLLLALSLIGGGLWLGPAGIIIGPLVVVLMLAMLRIYQQERG